MSIGYKVRKHREIKGWSQDELAQRLEVTQGTISNIESDKCVPSSLLLHKIAKELDVDLISLFERSYTHVEKNDGVIHTGTGTVNMQSPELLKTLIKIRN